MLFIHHSTDKGAILTPNLVYVEDGLSKDFQNVGYIAPGENV